MLVLQLTQYKLSKGGGGGDQVIRTEIQVGDNTRPFFPVSLWHKQMQLSTPGDVILLQSQFYTLICFLRLQHLFHYSLKINK